jgi:diguanylate cyclase (GGDEF)-like protein
VEFFQAYVQLASAALYNAQLFVQIQNHANELEARVRERTVQLESVNQELQKSQEALQELAIRDALTGLFNRREMERLLDEEMERQHRSKNTFSVSLIMLDIDHFKKINDTYGHQAGDAILQSLGKILIASTRQLDRVARFGGEEFVIIAPEISKNDVYSMAERLRNIVANHQFLISEGNGLATTIPVTISLGLASIPTDADSKSGLLKGADQALYEAKHRGRNQVIAFADIK